MAEEGFAPNPDGYDIRRLHERIASLEAELQTARNAIIRQEEAWMPRLESAEAEASRLAEALRPFAELAARMAGKIADVSVVSTGSDGNFGYLPLSAFRTARAALEAHREGK